MGAMRVVVVDVQVRAHVERKVHGRQKGRRKWKEQLREN
jgi:hypothetical protein